MVSAMRDLVRLRHQTLRTQYKNKNISIDRNIEFDSNMKFILQKSLPSSA